MANITPVDNWSDIPQIEQTDYVLGGEGQIANQQAQALANRTVNLKNTVTANKNTQDNKNTALDSAIESLNNDKVNKSDIVNNSSTTASGKVLDGRMGKTLNDLITSNYNTLNTNKINKSDIVTNYTTNNTSKVLAASVAVSLKALIDGKQPTGSYVLTSNIVNNTNTTTGGKVLDGRVGKTLADSITSNYNTLNTNKINKSDIVTNYTTNNTTKVLSASVGYALKALIDTKINTSDAVKITDIVNNLTSTATNKPLSAYQGKLLNDKIISSVPIGTVLPYFGADSSLPSTFQKCAGQTLTKASYPELFNAFLSAGMVSSSATSFVVPDLRKRYLKGSIRNDSAGYIGSLLNEKLPNITGQINTGAFELPSTPSNSAIYTYGNYTGHYGGADDYGMALDASRCNPIYGRSAQNGDGGQSVIPLSCIVNWIIRVK